MKVRCECFAGLLLDDAFYGIAVGRRGQSGILELDFLRLVGLDLFSRYIHFSQHGSIGMEDDLQVLLASRFLSTLTLLLYPIMENLTITLSAE